MNPEPARILIVDDDPIVAESLAEFVRNEGHEAATAARAEQALRLLAEAQHPLSPPHALPRCFDVVITDVSLPGMSGTELLTHIRQQHPGTVVIMLTGYGTVETAVEALRAGAWDFLTKPLVEAELRLALARALRQRGLERESRALWRPLPALPGAGPIVGNDPRMLKVYELVQAVAPTRTTVLMTGESGTGKSLIAHAIHQASPRRDRPFVELSCGAIPETLLESELFGHVRGAFTGAHADKVGRFQAADGGTLFLDEINAASPAMQLKLLRVLQERRFEPVGSSRTIEVDVRVVLASNQPLEALVAEGRFRQDLYYRINVVRIDLPPLRERVGDIPALAMHFLRVHADALNRPMSGFAPQAMEALQQYHYPGNVRELQNIVERAVVLARGPIVGIDDLPEHVARPDTRSNVSPALPQTTWQNAWTPMPLDQALREPERQILLNALRANGWNRQRTAKQLGINRTTLYKKMKRYGLTGRSDAA